MQSFAEWLTTFGLERYAGVFAHNGIDFDVVRDLSDEELRGLGLTLGDRKRLLQALAASSPAPAKGSSSASTSAASTAEQNAAGAERRQLTVLFCDLVGSTELSRRLDPEDYRELVKKYQSACAEVVAHYDGHIAQHLGDGLLVYFGFPRAHEDDAQRAVRAGLGVVDAVSGVATPDGPLAVRVGIHTGLVVVGDVGSGSSQEQLALGDTPNLAARLQALATPGTVVLSDQTHQLMGGGFEVRELGGHAVKGIAEPVRVWQALGARDAESRFEAATRGRAPPMVGRELEFTVVQHAWARARSGKGQMVLLCGEPGIGKSRILRALREEVVGEGAIVWQHQCSPYFANSALYPVINRLERGLEFGREDSPDARLDKLERVLTGYGRPAIDASLIGRLLSLPVEDRYGPLSMTPQKQKDETIRALNDVMVAASASHPLLVVFEDVHWADPTTLEFLEALLSRLDRLRVMLVVTYRPEFKPHWIGQPHVTALTLSRLDPEHTNAIAVRVAGGKSLPAEITAQIAAKTDGIPLFVEELTKAIVESGLLRETDGKFELSGPLPALAIPVTLRDSLMARLDRLAPVKEVAQTGACIGREFGQELLELISPLSSNQLQQALDALVASELVHKRGQPPATTYVFKHALIQDAAYESLLKAKRVQIHARIGHALEERFPATAAAQPELVAHHYTAAEMIEQAIPYWKEAGELAQRRVALQEAIAHLERGIGLIGRVGSPACRDRLELDLRGALGIAWIALQGWAYPEVECNLARAQELEEALCSGEHSLRVLLGLTVNWNCAGRSRDSLRWVERLLAQSDRSGDEDLRLVAYSSGCTPYYFLAEYAQMTYHAEGVLSRYDPARGRRVADLVNHDPKTTALVFTACAQWILGYPDRAVQAAQECLAHARPAGLAFELGWAVHFLAAYLFCLKRDPETCEALLDEFERLAHEHRLLFYEEVVAPMCRAAWLLLSGRPREADAKFREALPLWTKAGMRSGLPLWKTLHAHAAGLVGRLEDASTLLDEVLEQSNRPGWEERNVLPETLRIKGWILELKGDADGAEQDYRASLEWARKQQAKSWELRAATSYARLMQTQGRRREALELLQPVYDWFTEGRSTKDHLEAAALLEELR
jgi:class 3 adenylate cyclase/tetratricopeptide (TPR) repeat protein